MNSSPNNHFSPYLLSRFHQHLNHLNDMAFAHTKILQEIIEKRSVESSSLHGSITPSPSSASSSPTNDSRKRSYPHENHSNKRSRKQSKPQQVVKIEKPDPNEQSSEDEIGEINEKQNKPLPPSTMLPFNPNHLPFLNYLENLQKEMFTPSSLFSQTVHHHHHPYFSHILFNNSYTHHPKKRRTKVTDTRLSPRIASKIPSDEETSSSDDHPIKSEYNGFQISVFFHVFSAL